MASQMPVDDNSNTKSEEGTMAFHKKRARRVSFAENTSVHIFDRDEDSGTPLEPKPPSSPSDELGSGERNHGPSQLFWNVDEDDNDNNNEDDDMDEPGSRSPFLRFVGSPSSGGSTVGSANSNDEDNFFGPVSANFIRRDLLDSSASDANHDQTMDSTAFSMHFRSLARSDSEVELKTSTGVHLSFEEKTPTHESVPTNTGTPMLMTLAKKSNFQPSISTSKLSTKSESNDMSIVGEYHFKYDYGELSPTSDALTTEPSNISTLKSPRNLEELKQNEDSDSLMDLSCNEDNNVIGHELVNEDAFKLKSNLDFLTTGQSPKTTTYINSAIQKEHKSPFLDSSTIPSKSPLYVTPSHNHSSAFIRTENQENILSIQSIQKSISKLRMLEASPFSAALNAKLQDSAIKSVLKPSRMTPLNTLLEKNYKSPSVNSVKDSGHLSSDVQKKRARESSRNMDDNRLETPNNVVKVASPLKTNGVSQSLDFSSKKRLKVVDTTEVRRSPLRVEKSGSEISSTEEEMVEVREVISNEVHGDLETEGNSTILLENEEHEKFQDKLMGSDVVIGEMNGVSEVMNEGTDKQSCKKNLHEQFCQSPSNKQPHKLLQDEDMMLEIPSKIRTSPKVNVHSEISSEYEMSTIVHKFKHPTEINTMVSNEVNELLSQSVDKFNLHAIDRLLGILDQLLMSRTYQLISDEIQSQKIVDISKKLPHKRASEIKLLLCKLVHEKAKLQLMQMKQEKLLKRAKSLASGILESEELKSKFPTQISPNLPIMPLSVHTQINTDKVTSMGQTLNSVDQKIEELTKSFHKSCKMKEEVNSIDTITFVNNSLRKQACCQIIRKDMQLWVVDNLKSKNGCHSVDLNYLDLLTQRLMVNAGPPSSISVLHELNDVNISKIFKDMEACTAFRFVFNDGTTQKHVDSTNLAKETQVTGALFGNLLDVMEEIQQSRIQLKNLISTTFHSPLAGQLDLELSFFDPKHHTKATLSLNTSCLKRGIYPSKIIPYQIHISPNDPQKSSTTLADEITASLQNLKTGFLRIQRLCHCISNLITPPKM